VERLFPVGRRSAVERQALAEESIKTVFIMQFMDGWTFDTQRLANAVASICYQATGECPVAAITPFIASGTRGFLDFESQIVLQFLCRMRLSLKRFANLPTRNSVIFMLPRQD